MPTTHLLAASTLLAALLAGCTAAPTPAPSVVGTWTGKLVNTSVGASYDYRAVFAADGTASVTNETNKTVVGGWSASGSEVTLGFLLNGNNVIMKGQLEGANTYSGTWNVTGKPDFGTFKLQRN